MKKFSVLFFALVLALFCAACGSTTDDGDEEETDTVADTGSDTGSDNGGEEGGNDGDNGGEEGDNGGEEGGNGGEEGGNGGEEGEEDGECGEICKIKKADNEGAAVTVNKCIVTGIEFYTDNETHENQSIKGFYASEIVDQAKPYSGIYIFTKNADVDLYEIGDVLEVKGTYKRYPEKTGGPQIEAINEGDIIKLDKTGISLPKPAEIDDPAKIATPFVKDEAAIKDSCKEGWTSSKQHGADAAKYEGVLVKVKDVEIVEENVCHGAFTVTGDLVVYKNLHYYSGKRTAGKKFDSIQGVLMYSYDAYELAPTKEADLVESEDNANSGDSGSGHDGGDSGSAEVEASTVKDVQKGNAEDQLVKIENVTVISPVVENKYSDATKYTFYVSDGNTSDYSGLYIWRVSSDTKIAKGDKVTIEGLVKKQSGQWEVKGVDNADSITKTGTGTVPAAVKKAYSDLKDSDKGTYIEITDTLTVKSVDETYNNVTFTNGMMIMPFEDKNTVSYSLAEGDQCKVKGIYDVSHNKTAIIIIDANDIVTK